MNRTRNLFLRVWLCGTSLVVSWFAAACLGQGTFKVAFDGAPPLSPGTGRVVQDYYESGMAFTPIDPDAPFAGFGRTKGGGQLTGLCPDNGTAYLQAGAADSLKFWFTEGSLFGVFSVDLAGYSSVVPDFAIQFVGYRRDGSSVTADFYGNGLDFQTYYFGAEFSGLSRVEVSTIGWSMDNLVIVPEMKPLVMTSRFYGSSASRSVWVQAEGTTGLRYRLEYADDIASTNWTGLAEFTTSYLWTERITSASPPRRFFRAVLLP